MTLSTALFRPRRLGEEIRRTPSWAAAVLLLAFLGTLAVVLEHTPAAATTLAHLPPSATSTDREAAARWLAADLPRTTIIRPFRLLGGWLVSALVLSTVCRLLFGRQGISYRHFLSLEVHASSPLILGALAAGILATLPDGPWLPAPLATALLLKSFNIFTLWYLVILFGGVRVLCSAGPVKAAATVLLVWSSSLAFHALVVTLVRNALGLALHGTSS